MGHWGKLKQNHFEHEVKTIKHTYIKTSRNSILGKFIRDICKSALHLNCFVNYFRIQCLNIQSQVFTVDNNVNIQQPFFVDLQNV